MKKMNLYRLSIILIFFFSTSLLYAQKADLLLDQPLSEGSYVSVNLFSALNPLNPRYRVGYVRAIDTNWRFGIDFGYGSKKISFVDHLPLHNWGNIEDDYKLWEIRPELYYVINPKKLTHAYFSTELFYIHHKDVFHNEFIDTKDGGFFLYESANFRRQKYGMHLKFGLFANSSKKWGLNMYTGIGFRFRENTFSNITNPVPWEDHRDMIVIDYNEYEGLYFNWNLSLGCKLHFIL